MFLGEREGGADAEGDGFTMEKLAVREGGFDGVTDGVTKVEKGASAGGFLFIFFYDAGFDREIAEKEFRWRGHVIGVELAEVVEHGLVADGSVLDHFRKAFAVFTGRKGGEGSGIDEDE